VREQRPLGSVRGAARVNEAKGRPYRDPLGKAGKMSKLATSAIGEGTPCARPLLEGRGRAQGGSQLPIRSSPGGGLFPPSERPKNDSARRYSL